MDALMNFVILLAITFAFSLVGAWFTEWLVNHIFASTLLLFVFGATKLTFWQGFFINLLAGLFRGSSSSSKD